MRIGCRNLELRRKGERIQDRTLAVASRYLSSSMHLRESVMKNCVETDNKYQQARREVRMGPVVYLAIGNAWEMMGRTQKSITSSRTSGRNSRPTPAWALFQLHAEVLELVIAPASRLPDVGPRLMHHAADLPVGGIVASVGGDQ